MPTNLTDWAENYQTTARQVWIDEPLTYDIRNGSPPREITGTITMGASITDEETGVQLLSDEASLIIAREQFVIEDAFVPPQLGHLVNRTNHSTQYQVVQRAGRCWRPHGTTHSDIRIYLEEIRS